MKVHYEIVDKYQKSNNSLFYIYDATFGNGYALVSHSYGYNNDENQIVNSLRASFDGGRSLNSPGYDVEFMI